MAKFEGRKYMTKGFSGLPPFIQLTIFDIIEKFVAESNKEARHIDYLQVIRLEPIVKNNVICQKLIHTQEQPEYINEIIIEYSTPITDKCFIISDSYPDGEVITFLKALEY